MEGAPSGETPEQQPPRLEVEMELRPPEGEELVGFTTIEGLGVFTTAKGLAAAAKQQPELDNPKNRKHGKNG